MPKGKAKKDNPDTYQGSPQPSERNVTTQAATHRRGGTHKVRDEDRTDSVYDTYNYKELVDAAKEHSIYRKDMKKVEMAWALKRHDDEAKRAEQAAIQARRRAQQEAQRWQERLAAERQKQLEAKHRRKLAKMQKRDRDESVSDDTLSESDMEAEHNTRDEYAREAHSKALSESSWDTSSTGSSTASLDAVVVNPASKLRLFEWPYPILPSTTPPSPLSSIDPATAYPVFQPRQIPYAPLKLVTAFSRQKVVLPGVKYPASVAPDFAPVLSGSVREAVHKGGLTGVLRHTAVVETGAQWAARTIVQGWNGHLYFLPALRRLDGDVDAGAPKAGLADVYRKWALEERSARRVTALATDVGTGVACGDREGRKRRRRNARVKRDIEVFETSRWAPQAVGFVPAFLDFGGDAWVDGGVVTTGGERTLDRLRYVRFRGCDVPHYYFWVGGDGDGDEGGLGAGKRLDARTAMVFVFEDAKGNKDDEDGRNQRHARFPRKRPRTLSYPHPADDEVDEQHTELESDFALQEITSETSSEASAEDGLYRRSSISFPPHPAPTNSSYSIIKWLKHVSPRDEDAVSPLSEVDEVESWSDDQVGSWSWGKGERETGDNCPFCEMDWSNMTNHKKAGYVLAHSVISPSTSPSSHLGLGYAGLKRRFSLTPFCDGRAEVIGEDEGWEADVDAPVRRGFHRGSREVWGGEENRGDGEKKEDGG